MRKTLFLLLTLFAPPLHAGNMDPSLINKAEKYLNNMDDLKGTFIQNASTGAMDQGKFYIDRPGNMRLEYDSNLLLVADGDNLTYLDKNLDQKTVMPLNSNPAGIMLRKNINLTDGDLKVISTKEENNLAEIALQLKEEPGAGILTLIFKKEPAFDLIRWQIQDPQGITTTVTLENIKRNVELASSLFKVNHTRTFKGGGMSSGNGFY
jgi:outer membrane lipoprotein-sorting protein